MLLEKKQQRASCTIGYCKKPNCVKTKYAITTKRLYQTFFKFLNKKNKRVWRKIRADDDVMHCSVSPEPIYIKDVKQTKKELLKQINHLISVLNKGSPCPNGFRSYLKTITNTFIDERGKEHKTSYKLRFYKTIDKKGKEKEILVFNPLNLRGIKVFDIKYYHHLSKILPHYHLAIIPNNKKDFIPIALIQYIRKQIFNRTQKKLKTHLQFHLGDKKNRKQNLGYKPAKSVLTYMTKRAIGVFGKSDKYSEEDLENKKIETIFEDKGTYGYQDFVSVEDYMKYFHNQKTISYFGKEIKGKYTCNDMTFIKSHLPLKCVYCGELNKDQIEYSRSEELIAPPPPTQCNLEQYKDIPIIVKYINPKNMQPFSEEQNMINSLVRNSRFALSCEIIEEIKRASKIKYTGHEGDYDDFGVDKIDLNKFIMIDHKEKLQPLKPLEELEISKETKFEEMQKRLSRILNLKNNKIKLSYSDKIDLAITGRC